MGPRTDFPQPNSFYPPRLLTDTAVGTRKARCTLAAEPVDTVDADAPVVAAGERVVVMGSL